VPRLPVGLGDTQLPATGGVRGGTVGLPLAQEQGIDLSTATLPARSLAEMGQHIEQAGQFLVQADAYQAQRARAQGVLDSTLGFQVWAQEFQPAAAELAKGDYRTLPEQTVKLGKSLADKVALERNLSPEAKALFREKTEAAITKAQSDALGIKNQRFHQDTAFAMSTAVYQAQQEAAAAKDDTDLRMALDRLHGTLAEGVPAGLWHGDVAAKMYRDTETTVYKDRVARATQVNPDAMKTQLLAQLQGEPTRSDLPLAPPEYLAELYQHAQQVSAYQFQQKEHQERYADYARQKQQTLNSRDLRTKVYTTSLIPENVPTFQSIIEQAATAVKTGELDETTGEHIMHTAQAHMTTAGRPPPLRDDEPTKRTLNLAIRAAARPEEFDQVRNMLTEATKNGQITADTYGPMYDKLDQREKVATDWLAYPEVQAAKNVIMRGALVPYGGTLAGQMKPLMQQKLTWAVDTWEAQLESLYADPQGGPKAVKAQADALAWEARRQHLQPDINNKADAEEYLPPEVQKATSPAELAQAIHALRMLGWSNGSLLIIRDNWHRWMDAQREQAARRSGPVTPGPSGMPSSYQLPSLGTTPPSGRRSQ
jgi:hypothetical protein